MEAILDLATQALKTGDLAACQRHLEDFRAVRKAAGGTAGMECPLRKRCHDLANKLMVAQFRAMQAKGGAA